MPWQSEAKKDVTACDKRRWGGNILWPGDFWMGKPNQHKLVISSIDEKQTGRSETSQYPEEKTSKEIPQVAASERGGADQFYSSKMAWESQP